MKTFIKANFRKISAFLFPKIVKTSIQLLLWTCRWDVVGLDQFCRIAQNQKSILLFWHNRLALAPFIFSKFAPQFTYAAFVSNSRDGDLLASIIHSFECGKTIRVPHSSRHAALGYLIKHIKTENDVVIITPDGPRGPRYVMKPGAALAAVETGAYLIPFDWKASSYWSFQTWDALRLPRPFSRIVISFEDGETFKEHVDLDTVIGRMTDKMHSSSRDS